MKQFKKIFAIILMMCMVMSLCACGGSETDGTEKNSEKNTENSQAAGSENGETESQDDGKIQYTVKVVDESGNPIASTYVQLCDDSSCYLPTLTDENGVAEFEMAEGEYKAAISTMPEGYVDCTGEYFYFDGDATEVTITLKKAE